ncbi:MAG TPA: tRNA (adenosine(37)-N6)-threonylcarbamoyltransferase complex ATPase subunit type 1 TsaE [Limnochordia bacterium]
MSTQPEVFESESAADTMALAARLVRLLRPGDAVVLGGPLGAGKTTFVKGLAAGLGIDPAVVISPTFTLIHEYAGPIPLFHFDLYRLRSGQELAELGFEEYLERGGIVAIEWGEPLLDHLAAELVPEAALLSVRLSDRGSGGTSRCITIDGKGERAAAVVRAMAAAPRP